MEDGFLVTTQPMTQTMRLLQLASSYGEVETKTIVDPVSGEEKTSEKLILTAPSSKIDAFMEDLDDFEGRATIVFTVSSQFANLLSEALEKKKIDHGMITGAQNEWEREQAIERFQKGYTKFIIMTIAAGGTGITLDRGRHGGLPPAGLVLDQHGAVDRPGPPDRLGEALLDPAHRLRDAGHRRGRCHRLLGGQVRRAPGAGPDIDLLKKMIYGETD